MRETLAKVIDGMLRPLGLTCLRGKDAQRQEIVSGVLIEMANSNPSIGSPTENPFVTGIVFSRDRACQLYALLESFHAKTVGNVPLHVLFKASSARHLKAYEEVRADFADKPVTWINETDFREDLLKIFKHINSYRVFFLVDDIVVTREMDFERLRPFPPGQCVVSFRLGENITRHHQQPLPSPALRPSRIDAHFREWSWAEGELNWGYPLSVDGHLFATYEIRAMAKELGFSAPNSFEKALQMFRPVFARRLGICFRESRLVNLPLNMVQTERKNYHGDVQPEFLLEQWEAGRKIAVEDFFEWTNQSLHQEHPLRFVPR